LTIANTEIDGGIYWTGSGVLTLYNDIIKPDGAINYTAVAAPTTGNNVAIANTTILGKNVGAKNGQPNAINAQDVTASHLNVGSVCTGIAVGGYGGSLTDSYFHDIGSGVGSNCHAQALIFQAGMSGGFTIRHNALDLAPGQGLMPGQTAAIFEQGIYGHVPQITIDDNYLHGGYYPIFLSQGKYRVTTASPGHREAHQS
jgi:hypothetical protein